MLSPNKQAVERYMAAYSRWDHAAVLELLTDDIEWVLPGLFTKRGKAEVDAEIEGECNSGPPEISIERLVEEGAVVIAEGRVRQPREDGSEVRLFYIDVFEFRQGKISRLTSYLMPQTD
jgi:ketosteroid isomerase-like protein